MLNDIRIGLYKFTLLVGLQGLELPTFNGSTLRGAFGNALKRITCVERNRPSCHSCSLEDVCAYAYLFETTPPEGAERLKSYDDVPRPFVTIPMLKGKTHFHAGEELDVEVRLFGKGIDFLPYVVLAFINLAETGLGVSRKPCLLKYATAYHPVRRTEAQVFSVETHTIRSVNEVMHGSDVLSNLPAKAGIVGINFLTPLRLKADGALVSSIQFQHLTRSLLRRISSIMAFHQGIKLELDYSGLSERSRQIKRTKDLSTWYDLERYSLRQDTRMKMGGVVGNVEYTGELTEFLPLLEIGRWVLAGKNSVFGLGQFDYVVRN